MLATDVTLSTHQLVIAPAASKVTPTSTESAAPVDNSTLMVPVLMLLMLQKQRMTMDAELGSMVLVVLDVIVDSKEHKMSLVSTIANLYDCFYIYFFNNFLFCFIVFISNI